MLDYLESLQPITRRSEGQRMATALHNILASITQNDLASLFMSASPPLMTLASTSGDLKLYR